MNHYMVEIKINREEKTNFIMNAINKNDAYYKLLKIFKYLDCPEGAVIYVRDLTLKERKKYKIKYYQ